MVGIPVLAQKLVQIQATLIVKCLPDIIRKINDKLSSNVDDLNKLPRNMMSIAEAMTAFMQILGSAKESLRKILLRGEFDEYPDNDAKNRFLLDEISVLEEAKAIGLPNFLPRTAFLTLLTKKVKGISFTPFEFVDKTWGYIEWAAQNLVAMKKKQSESWVLDIVEMEKMTDYTCNPEQVAIVQEAFDLKMRLTAYWKIVLRRLVDCMALHLLFSVQNLVNKEMEVEIINEVIGLEGNGLERMLEESPVIAEKRKRLNSSIELLRESKDVVAKIIDNIATISLG
ncbi:dynamin-related protein 4c [Phtheirospermum japonicum]|uniref:Dynamin-related protein 4c n=1 Tax=Phtheirospermum japonicum TaxID=374723 RepID=A0A830D7Q0_9LAMI|nr:dynamin-related protein 4c [Phtheirospermum japonicum]